MHEGGAKGWADRKVTGCKCHRGVAAVVVCRSRCGGSVVVVVVPSRRRRRHRRGGGGGCQWARQCETARPTGRGDGTRGGRTRCRANRLGRRVSVDRSGWGTNLAFFDSEGCTKGARRGGMDGRRGCVGVNGRGGTTGRGDGMRRHEGTARVGTGEQAR